MTKKALKEELNKHKHRMESLLNKAKTEKRALSSDETLEFEEHKSKAHNIREQLKKLKNEEVNYLMNKNLTDIEKREYKSFADHIRSFVSGDIEKRESTLNKGESGSVIPKTIVNKIVEKLEDISPLYKFATKYHDKGTVIVPLEDNSSSTHSVAYVEEFAELTSSTGKLSSIELTGHLYGALTKISKSLLNNTDFDLVNYVVGKIARAVAKFIENEALNGSEKTKGIVGSYDAENMKVVLANKDKIASDELIDIQECVPDEFQSDCIWIMNRKTRKVIRKLKDGQGNYLFEKDSTAKWGYKLLNNDVFVTDNAKELGENDEAVIFYGDFSGLAIKETEKPEIQVLLEKFAAQHAIGVVVHGEIDAKVENTQKIAVGVTPTA